jgi:hypothetical protein
VTKKHDLLTEALDRKAIVRFWNRFDGGGSTDGFVLDIGPRFFLLALIDEYMKFNGYQCPLLKDIKRLEVPARYEAFTLAALRKRKQLIKQKPQISLSSISELLESANLLFPLITIHRESVKPDSCWIGRVIEISKSAVLLHEIGPDAVWDKEPTKHLLSEITRVEFGGGYEEALHLVGGRAPRLHL